MKYPGLVASAIAGGVTGFAGTSLYKTQQAEEQGLPDSQILKTGVTSGLQGGLIGTGVTAGTYAVLKTILHKG